MAVNYSAISAHRSQLWSVTLNGAVSYSVVAGWAGVRHNPGDVQTVVQQPCRGVGPLMDLFSTHHQRVAQGQRRDGAEGRHVIVGIDEPTWQLARDDARD